MTATLHFDAPSQSGPRFAQKEIGSTAIVFRMRDEEIAIMRQALETELKRLHKELAAPTYLGYPSAAGIALCQRRSAVEALLEQFENPTPALCVVPQREKVEEMPLPRVHFAPSDGRAA